MTPRGLALLTAPEACDPDVSALFEIARDKATLALYHATVGQAARIHYAEDLATLREAVTTAFAVRRDHLLYMVSVARDHYTHDAHALAQEACDLDNDAWRKAMAGVMLHRSKLPAHEVVVATAGPSDVDADGRGVA